MSVTAANGIEIDYTDSGGDGPVVVASYVLAPGYFADKIRIQASQAGATAVSAPLGAASEVAEVILDRYLSAISITVLARNQTDSGDALAWGRTRSGRFNSSRL